MFSQDKNDHSKDYQGIISEYEALMAGMMLQIHRVQQESDQERIEITRSHKEQLQKIQQENAELRVRNTYLETVVQDLLGGLKSTVSALAENS
jgi:hypothetical protein